MICWDQYGHTQWNIWPNILIVNHTTDIELSDVAAAFDTTVLSHPGSTTLNTNIAINESSPYVNLEAAKGGTAPTSQIYSATGDFTAALVGRSLVITGGPSYWLPGMYAIIEYIDANTIVVSKGAVDGQPYLGGNSGEGYITEARPFTGNLFVTSAAGLGEVVPYSSWQNDGSGNMQFTITAPVQTFASGDTVNFYDLCFQEPRHLDIWRTAVTFKLYTTLASTVDFTLTITDIFFYLYNNSSIYLSRKQTPSRALGRPILVMGAIDETGEYDVLTGHQGLIFHPDSLESAGLFSHENSDGTSPDLFNTFIKAPIDGTKRWGMGSLWHGSLGVGNRLNAKYCTFYNLDDLAWRGHSTVKRCNFLGGSSSYDWQTWGAVVNMTDTFFNNNIQKTPDGTFGIGGVSVGFADVNWPLLNGHRIAFSDVNTGDKFKLYLTDCDPLFADADYHVWSQGAGKTTWGYQQFRRYLRVVDTDGNGIEGVAVNIISAAGAALYNKNYVTNADGWCNSGNLISSPIYKKWTVSGGTPAGIVVTDGNPYTVTCVKAGYTPTIDTVTVDNKQRQLIRVRMDLEIVCPDLRGPLDMDIDTTRTIEGSLVTTTMDLDTTQEMDINGRIIRPAVQLLPDQLDDVAWWEDLFGPTPDVANGVFTSHPTDQEMIGLREYAGAPNGDFWLIPGMLNCTITFTLTVTGDIGRFYFKFDNVILYDESPAPGVHEIALERYTSGVPDAYIFFRSYAHPAGSFTVENFSVTYPGDPVSTVMDLEMDLQ